MSSDEKIEGSCLCGEVGFSVQMPTLYCVHCHCSMCRRSHGSAFVTWFGVPYERFSVLSGEENLVRFQSSAHGKRSFCGLCGSALFCELESHPERIDITLASLNGEIDRKPGFHVYFDDRAAWTFVDDGLPRLGGETGLEAL